MRGRQILLSITLFCSISIVAQKEINFEHKAINKEIEKKLELSDFELLPMPSEDTAYTQGQYFTITNRKSQIGYIYVGRVNSCRSGGCSVSNEENTNFSFEYFDYLILYTQEVQIKSVKIFNYQASHGHEVCSRNWLKQFNGYSGERELQVGKDIDGISGATISVYSLTFDIEKVSTQLKENQADWKTEKKEADQVARKEDS